MKKIDVVCGVILNNNNEFLITQRGDKYNFGKWEFPGGKVEDGEDYFTSIVREIKEELNLKIKPIEKIHEYVFGQYLLTFIKCQTQSISISLQEHNDFKWVQIIDLKSYEFIDGDVEFVNFILENGII